MYLKSVLLALGLALGGTTLAEEVKLPHGGITLNANLEKTGDNWHSGPVVLMTHGTLAHSRMEIMAGLQEMLLDRGVSSLSINLSLGLDDREAAMYPCETPHRHKYNDAEEEVGAWMAWLKGQGAGNVSLLGHSRGGNQTARFAAANDASPVETVFLLAPSLRNQGYGETDYKRRYGKELMPIMEKAREMVAAGKGDEMLQKVDFIYCKEASATAAAFISNYEPEANGDTPTLISRIKSPVMVIVGSEDKVVSGLVEKIEPIADGERVQLVIVEGAGHFFLDLYSEDVADTIAETLGAE
ncbi:MAG: alpha/beta hydrolase [Candidatus Sedimenticola sp. PURPLELP]